MNNRNVVEKKKSYGSCLITFFGCCLVVGILAAIAIPDFLKFCAPAKQSEAKTNLGAIFTTQVSYFGEYGTYAGGKDCFARLGWSPEGETKYTYHCGGDTINPTRRGVAPTACLAYPPVSSKRAFTVCASGNIDHDATVDEWIMNDAKVLTNVVNDIGD